MGLLVSFRFMCVCLCVHSCARIEFGLLLFISKRIPFQMAFPDSYFLWHETEDSHCLFQGFCFPSLKHESTGRKRFTAWECSGSPWLLVLYHMAVDCEDFSTVKKILKPLCMIFIKYLGLNCVLRGKNGLFTTDTFCSTQQGSMSAILSRALSAFVLNRFFIWVDIWQNTVGDILQWKKIHVGVMNVLELSTSEGK